MQAKMKIDAAVDKALSGTTMRPRPLFDESPFPLVTSNVDVAIDHAMAFKKFREEERAWFEELLASPHVQAVLKIPTGEPIFVLRAQDKLSVRTINQWLILAGPGGIEDVNNRKFLQAMEDYRQFKEWQKNNPDKVKIPD